MNLVRPKLKQLHSCVTRTTVPSMCHSVLSYCLFSLNTQSHLIRFNCVFHSSPHQKFSSVFPFDSIDTHFRGARCIRSPLLLTLSVSLFFHSSSSLLSHSFAYLFRLLVAVVCWSLFVCECVSLIVARLCLYGIGTKFVINTVVCIHSGTDAQVHKHSTNCFSLREHFCSLDKMLHTLNRHILF